MAEEEAIDHCLASLGIEDEENEVFVLQGEIEEDVNRYELCLVGRLLTEKSINVRAMKSKIADVWRPAMGLNIKELAPGLFLFQLYQKDDRQWVLNGGPWSFDNVMLALEIVEGVQNPAEVIPCFLQIWIQLHNLPVGYMQETVGKQLGNFFGDFMEYDTKNSMSIWRDSMRVRIRIDVRKPLKRKKKIVKKDGQEIIVLCKYERLGEFCFTCGMVTYTDRFCRISMNQSTEEVVKEWGRWLRAPPRRAARQVQSKWLRDENDDTWESRIGGEHFSGDNILKKGKEIKVANNYRKEGVTEARDKGDNIANLNVAIFKGFSTTSNALYELSEEDSDIIQLEDRKRRMGFRTEPGNMEIDLDQHSSGNPTCHKQGEATISNEDFSAPTQLFLAELARQASHSQ